MAFAIGGILAAIYLLLGLLLAVGAFELSELARCSDPAGIAASGEDDCIDTSPGGRTAGLFLAYGSVAAAFATVWLGVHFARRRQRGVQLAVAAVGTPVLALGALWLLPLEF